MDYRIREQGSLFVVQYFRKGWQTLRKQPKFKQYTQAYDWIVKEKFGGDHARAINHIWWNF